MIRYAEEMNRKVQVDGSLVEQLKSTSPPRRSCCCLTIASANLTNRFNETLGTELES